MTASIEMVDERPELPELILRHGNRRVRLSLQGAHITEYAPEGHGNLLWVSKTARYERGAAIRGGIPLCWPWFGANPDMPDRPQHGFARMRAFEVIEKQADPQGISVTLQMDASSEFPEWKGAARLEVQIRLDDRLWMEMRTTNLSDRCLTVGAGLHSYFRVSDCRTVSIPALTGLTYLDKPSDFERKVQTEPLCIDGEVDRIYLDAPADVDLIDARRSSIRINGWGHSDLVVWNPGAVIAKSMSDFDDDGYVNMVCVEPALALDNRRRLAPGETHAIGQMLTAVGPVTL